MKAIITVGISASGKSTWAKEYAKTHKNTLITNRDDLRFSITGASGWGEYKFNHQFEDVVSEIQQTTIQEAALTGKDVIIADTNLAPKTRHFWEQVCKDCGYEVEYKNFPITLEEAWKRDGLRANGVGRDVIYKQWLTYIGRKQYKPNTDLPEAVMFDIDGTLAHRGERGPFDWKRVGEDAPDITVREMLWDFQSRGYKIILLSGRDSVCRNETYYWCEKYGIVYDELIMRAEDDTRKDTIIKEEIFWRDVVPFYNVTCVVDDRPCVVRMWHDIKIPKVIAVGDQNVEF